MSDNQQCAECGMPVEPGEYHPYTACLIFKQTSSSKAVHMNLSAVLHEGGNRWRSVAEQAEKALRSVVKAWEYPEMGWVIDVEIEAALSAFDSLRKEQD